MRPTAQVSEQVNRKYPLGARLCNFQPLHRPQAFKLPTSKISASYLLSIDVQ